MSLEPSVDIELQRTQFKLLSKEADMKAPALNSIIKLIYAGRALAEDKMTRPQSVQPLYLCTCCGATMLDYDLPLIHNAHCKVARFFAADDAVRKAACP